MKKLLTFSIVLLTIQACEKEENSLLSKIKEAKEQASTLSTTIENVTQASKASSSLGLDFEKDGSRSKIQFVSNNRYIIELEESIWE